MEWKGLWEDSEEQEIVRLSSRLGHLTSKSTSDIYTMGS